MQEEAEKKAQDENAFNEKIKKRIKINVIKPEIFKKKRDNIGAFITVEPNPFEKGLVQEIEEIQKKKKNHQQRGEEPKMLKKIKINNNLKIKKKIMEDKILKKKKKEKKKIKKM